MIKKQIYTGLKIFWQRFRRALSLLAMKAPGLLIMIFSAFSFLFMNAFIIQFEYWSNQIIPESKAPQDFGSGLWSFLQIFNTSRWTPETSGRLGAMIAPGLLFALTLTLLYQMRYRIFKLDIERKTEGQARPRRVLIMGLSVFNNFDASPADEFTTLTLNDTTSYITKSKRNFQWQQNLRVLNHHLSGEIPQRSVFMRKLCRFRDNSPLLSWFPWPVARRQDRHVFILPSQEGCQMIPNSSPPQKYVDCFTKMAEEIIKQSALPDGHIPSFHVWERNADYNDLEGLKSAFHEIIAHVKTDQEIMAWEDEISIDTTAGTKLQSIAAAAATFASPIEFSYIEQGTNKFVAFDVTAGFRELG